MSTHHDAKRPHWAAPGFGDGAVHAPTAPNGPSVDLEEATSTLRVSGRIVCLTQTQFAILAYLVSRAERWVTAAELIERVLRTHHEPDTPLIRVHVHAIRRRLGDAACYLEADRRYWRGYRWCTSGRAEEACSRSGTHALRPPPRSR